MSGLPSEQQRLDAIAFAKVIAHFLLAFQIVTLASLIRRKPLGWT